MLGRLIRLSPLLLVPQLGVGSDVNDGSNDYDFFLFAQMWPTSVCNEWIEKSADNTCTIRVDWTVHGLWPTQIETTGPFYCDPNAVFDPDQVKSLWKQLALRWTNVHKNTDEYSLWKHEWEKHGTCALNNSKLDSELKYFSEGLKLNEKFPIGKFLRDANITPGKEYMYDDIFQALQKALGGKHPGVQCDFNEESGKHELVQVDICLDKSLELIDCDQIAGGLNHGCPSDEALSYPNSPAGSKWWIAFLVIFFGCILGVAGYFIWKRIFGQTVTGYEAI